MTDLRFERAKKEHGERPMPPNVLAVDPDAFRRNTTCSIKVGANGAVTEYTEHRHDGPLTVRPFGTTDPPRDWFRWLADQFGFTDEPATESDPGDECDCDDCR